ncbi:MAG: hypothetical protein MUF72_20520 [Elainella sp. Prado103]|jgi:pimeloyl-[acyl-carrier protein] methyl ester esterase|nr:hypothetical protein [Elainella sp. Prado103]
MKTITEIIAYHGWGFRADCWQAWQTQLMQQGYAWQSFDRGYFGSSHQPIFTPTARKIILVHSYGLHLCPIEQLQQADVLVIFSSFQAFHPVTERLRQRSQQVVERMIEQFQVDPQQVLTQFYQNCYSPQVWRGQVPAPIAIDRLKQDLQQLNRAEFDLNLFKPIPLIVKFHGLNDRIVAGERLSFEQITDHLQNPPINHTINNAGHALPFTHQAVCWTQLQSILDLSLR